jgi:hypothetical protein
MLDGDGLVIKRTWAVCNPMLVNSFALTLEKFTARAETSRTLFYSEKWRFFGDEEDLERREWTLGQLKSRMGLFPWNLKTEVW